MKRTVLILWLLVVSVCVLPANASTYIGNMAEGTAILRVSYERNEDGTFTSQIDLNPNVGEDRVTLLQLTIQGDLFQSVTTDSTAIALIGGANVNYTSQLGIAEYFDANYDAERDTVIDDTYYTTVFEMTLTPDDGSQSMYTEIVSKYALIGGTVPGSSFSPLARVTTLGDELHVSGYMYYTTGEPNPFSVSLVLPEPSAAVLAIMGSLAVIPSARRRRR